MAEFDFAILGAGAMGSIVGAHLARAGHSVAMLARGARAAHLEQHGLTIRGLAQFTVAVHTLRDPAALGGAGALIVATKTPGTEAALAALRHAHFGVTLSIQNGPLKNDLLAAAFGAERVLGALADTSGELLADGEVLFTRNVNILVGELAGGTSERAEQLARTIDAAGVRAAATPAILSLEWSKFCPWVGLMALAVTTRAPTWEYLSDPDSALLLVRLVREMGQPTAPCCRPRACAPAASRTRPSSSPASAPSTAAMPLVTGCRRCRTSRRAGRWRCTRRSATRAPRRRGSDCGYRCWRPSARCSRRSTACAAVWRRPAETYGALTAVRPRYSSSGAISGARP
jgi:2-dehydropantoate 2-reductase